MGRSNPAPPPAPVQMGQRTVIGGETRSRQYTDGNDVVTEYFESAADKAAKQRQIDVHAKYDPLIDVFSPEVEADINNQVGAMQKDSADEFNNQYDNSSRQTRASVAGSFGGLNNSVYRDNVADAEKIRGDAMGKLARGYTASRQAIKDDIIAQRRAYLNDVDAGGQQYTNNAFNAMSQGSSVANQANDFNLSNYQNQMSANTPKKGFDWMGAAMTIGGAALGSVVPGAGTTMGASLGKAASAGVKAFRGK